MEQACNHQTKGHLALASYAMRTFVFSYHGKPQDSEGYSEHFLVLYCLPETP